MKQISNDNYRNGNRYEPQPQPSLPSPTVLQPSQQHMRDTTIETMTTLENLSVAEAHDRLRAGHRTQDTPDIHSRFPRNAFP